MIPRKTVTIKDATPQGIVVAKIAELNSVDKDGDLTLPGYFGKQPTIMLPTHDWSHVPIGKGVVRETDDSAVAEIKMNLDIPAAKDWHSALMFDLKEGSVPLQEYSYGFTINPGGSSPADPNSGQVDEKAARRILRPMPDGSPGCKVHEVSPVVVGAGNNTGTLAAKGAKFADEADSVVKSIDELIQRATSLADLRAKEGRSMSATSREKLKHLLARLDAAQKKLLELTPDDHIRKLAMVELGRALKAGL